MKKILTLIVAAALLLTSVFALASCKGKDEKTIILGFDAEYPPFGYLDEATNTYTGFDIEYAQKVCANLGYKLVLNPIDWDAKDALMESGAIDMIWNGFTYEGRENDYEWTDKYISNSIVVLVKSDSGIADLAGLAGKKVVAQSDSSAEAALKAEDNAELVASFKDGEFALEAAYTTAFEKLKTGAVDAIAVDVGVANYLVANNAGYTILGEAVSAENYAVGFKKGNTALCNEINAEMNKVAKEDAKFIQDLCAKYDLDYSSFLLGKK